MKRLRDIVDLRAAEQSEPLDDTSLRLPLVSPMVRARNITLFCSGFIYAALFGWLTVRAYAEGEPEIASCNAIGVVIALIGIATYLRGFAMWPILLIGCIYYPLLSASLAFVGYAEGATVVWLILVPPLTFVSLGARLGLAMTVGVLPVLIVALTGMEGVPQLGFSDGFRLRLIACYMIIGAVSTVSALFAERYAKELIEARERIASLEELLPMCTYCKKVRVAGEWDHLENYIERQSGALVSHGMCSTCFDDRMGGASRRGSQSSALPTRVNP